MGSACEVLGVPPSQITKKFPDITEDDLMFLEGYGIQKINRLARVMAEILGRMMSG